MPPEQKPKSSNLAIAQLILVTLIIELFAQRGYTTMLTRFVI